MGKYGAKNIDIEHIMTIFAFQCVKQEVQEGPALPKGHGEDWIHGKIRRTIERCGKDHIYI